MIGLIKMRHAGNVFRQDAVIQLSDIAGAGRFTVKDRDGATVFSVDSQGNVRKRGQDLRV